MLTKVFLTYVVVVLAGAGTGTVARTAESAPVERTSGSRQLPAAPAIPTQGRVPAPSPLSASQMSASVGQGPWGWIKRIWKKVKKKFFRICGDWFDTITTTVFTETSEYVEGVSGEVVEVYEGEDQTQVDYNSQSDYENNVVASTSYTDYGYTHAGSDYSGGSYEY